MFTKLYEVYEGEMTYYLVIELLRGRTLQEEIESLRCTQLKERHPMKSEVIM